jgi:hypothetical protein
VVVALGQAGAKPMEFDVFDHGCAPV